ncbi:MAG: hypothetical protein QG646_3237 [Euryarchaeota archaeon]|nr:hypothetical protein [Euryarchaeota archaeon]
MKTQSLFPILLLTFVLVFISPNFTKAAVLIDAAEIPYQVNNSDRIIIGTVSGIIVSTDHTIATITVNEWLYNPLPEKTIKVRTEIGTNVNTEDQPVFIQNESVLLMLKDQDMLSINEDELSTNKDVDKQQFIVSVGFVGKHSISDRDAVINELKAQGKWKGADQTGNKTNETETVNKIEITSSQKENITENMTATDRKAENTATIGKQEGELNTTQISKSTPFISSIWILAIVFMAVILVKKMKQ